MPLNNLIRVNFTQQEREDAFFHFNKIRDITQPKLRQLSAEEKQRYGSIRGHNRNMAHKIRDYYLTNPSNSAPEVEWTIYINSLTDRDFLFILHDNMVNYLNDVNSTRILHDHDIYRAALADYDYTKYRAKWGIPSAIGKAADLRQYFYFGNGGSGGQTPDTVPTPPVE